MKKICFLILAFVQFISANDYTYKISSGFLEPEVNLVGEVIKEGFSRAGEKLEFQILPNQRSLINANSGINDGDGSRIWEIANFYPNLVRVSVPTHSIDLMILSKKKIFIKKLSDLKFYHVGVIRGMKIAEKIASENTPLSLTMSTNYINLMKMLGDGRLDFIIINKIALYTLISGYKDEAFYMHKKPLMSRLLYMHLHKKHAAMIPKFEKAFTSMHEDGTFKRIQMDFVKKMSAGNTNFLKVIEYD
ncbi:transporter substrate-binding domain-containing protein [Sulfurimonas aquatica]|uniref:Transporter substrate-binding domain-containing protein n=1 Tax=Sulfurimonas aquatica TaxID=2672570 RepID=A0A975GBM7_9BACT|nr:transporter substrate-binding domain-containing protein [Sulfurimonas aquatica]QSZ40597.1 transporter substrate-binding domain-containing protein [Sulfurimonas aquatica]